MRVVRQLRKSDTLLIQKLSRILQRGHGTIEIVKDLGGLGSSRRNCTEGDRALGGLLLFSQLLFELVVRDSCVAKDRLKLKTRYFVKVLVSIWMKL